MNGTFRALSRKDFRELLPWAAAIGVTVMACSAGGQRVELSYHARLFELAGVSTYLFGVIALGAMCVGHEYSHRTLTTLLSQPVERWRLLAAKLAALAPVVGVLTFIVLACPWKEPGASEDLRLVKPAILASLFVAPWLAMLTRSTLAGTVFAVAAPSIFLIVPPSFVGRIPPSTFLLWVVSALAAVSAFMMWRTFLRLEAIDGPQSELDLPGWLRQRTIGPALLPRGRTDSSFWQTIAKELRLQQMTFLVAVLFGAAWFTTALLRKVAGLDPDFTPISLIYSAFVGVVAGAMAIAEERHLGTADGERLQPVSGQRQFAIKVAVAFATALVLAKLWPVLLRAVAPGAENVRGDSLPWAAAAALFGAAFYASSMSATGIRAFLAALPGIAATIFLIQAVTQLGAIGGFTRGLANRVAQVVPPFTLGLPSASGPYVLMTAVAVQLVLFSYANYRSGERNQTLVRRRLPWVAVSVLLTFAVMDVIQRVWLIWTYPQIVRQ